MCVRALLLFLFMTANSLLMQLQADLMGIVEVRGLLLFIFMTANSLLMQLQADLMGIDVGKGSFTLYFHDS